MSYYLRFDENQHNADDFIDSSHLFRWKHFSCKCKKHTKYAGTGKNKTVVMSGKAAIIDKTLLDGLNELTLLLRKCYLIDDMKISIKTAYRCPHLNKQEPISYGNKDIVELSNFSKGSAVEILSKGISPLKLYNIALMIPQFSEHCIGINNKRNVVYIDTDFRLPPRRRFFI